LRNIITEMSSSSANPFFAIATHPVKFKLFLLKNLPAAYLAGVRVRSVTEEEARVTIPYKWLTRNPFRSTYFASLSMAAEMSTGVLAMAHIYKRKPAVSLLVIAIEGKFYKKATDKTIFVCREGTAIKAAIEQAIASGEPQSVKALSSGFNKAGELVAEFWVTWSFKAKKRA
jgi:hypothetical protein